MYPMDPTLYGATFPYRDASFMSPYFRDASFMSPYFNQFTGPYFNQWQNQWPNQWPTPQPPWATYGTYGRIAPPAIQSEFLPPVQSLYGKYFMQPYAQLPYTPFVPGSQGMPQFKWQVPFVH